MLLSFSRSLLAQNASSVSLLTIRFIQTYDRTVQRERLTKHCRGEGGGIYTNWSLDTKNWTLFVCPPNFHFLPSLCMYVQVRNKENLKMFRGVGSLEDFWAVWAYYHVLAGLRRLFCRGVQEGWPSASVVNSCGCSVLTPDGDSVRIETVFFCRNSDSGIHSSGRLKNNKMISG